MKHEKKEKKREKKKKKEKEKKETNETKNLFMKGYQNSLFDSKSKYSLHVSV